LDPGDEDSDIVEQGKHEKLLAKKGFYAPNFTTSQFGRQRD